MTPCLVGLPLLKNYSAMLGSFLGSGPSWWPWLYYSKKGSSFVNGDCVQAWDLILHQRDLCLIIIEQTVPVTFRGAEAPPR